MVELDNNYLITEFKNEHVNIENVEETSIVSSKILGPKIVTIGGGTGLSTMLRGLKKYTANITAIVTVADDGGSSGYIRTELGMLPPGDIRNCISALANVEPTMIDLLNYRFPEGKLKGQSFGNLFLAALNGVYGSFEEAVYRMNDVLAVTGKVLPVTTSDINLEAVFEDGSTIKGESKIFNHKKTRNCRIVKVNLVPEKPPALNAAIDAILDADVVILGPGSLYTSIIPNLLVQGITQALERTSALRIYVLNVMTQDGETEEYSALDHIKALYVHSSDNVFDTVIYNNAPISEELLKKYNTEGASPVVVEDLKESGIEAYGYPIINDSGDLARHDSEGLARAIFSVIHKKRKRNGIYNTYDSLVMKKINNK